MVASDSFAEFLREQLAPLGRVTLRRMFGKTGVFCDGAMLGMVTENTLYFRVDDHNRVTFKEAASSSLKGILDVSEEPLVSSDYIGSLYSSVVDALSTNVIDGTLVHVSSWYDNEMGYSARCADLLAFIAGK